MKDPHNAPLGAPPMLPEPQGEAARRGHELFKRFLDATTADEPVAPAAEAFVIDRQAPPAVERDYTLAWEAIQEVVGDADLPEIDADELEVAEAVADDGDAEAMAQRPPPGAPTIRPSVRSGKSGVNKVSQTLLEDTAQSAMLVTEGDNVSAFEVSFRDELFEDVTCRITLDGGRVVASFSTSDPNTRRLLEAESGMLRARLEERGLRVEEIKVEQRASSDR